MGGSDGYAMRWRNDCMSYEDDVIQEGNSAF
jgi:hypothetical protein